MPLALSAISPVDVSQPWHILVFFQAAIALIYLMTKANHVRAQICHFTSFVRFLWWNLLEKTVPKMWFQMAYFLLTFKDMIVYVLWQKLVGEGCFIHLNIFVFNEQLWFGSRICVRSCWESNRRLITNNFPFRCWDVEGFLSVCEWILSIVFRLKGFSMSLANIEMCGAGAFAPLLFSSKS